MKQKLFSSYRLGPLDLPNRMVMAPLTRSRAGEGNVPTQLVAKYYRQRSTAGLIISEATQICPEGQGYVSTPGIYSPAQIDGWKAVTKAVHDAEGRIILQLWHVGRISHTHFQPNGVAPVAPSAIQAQAKAYFDGQFVDVSMPRALETAEIPGIVETYAQAARNAMEAGFDGVEIHGANGYLIDQFLRDKTNLRTDRYGGPIESRSRFLLEIVDAVAAVVGKDRTGIRLSPVTPFGDISDSNPQALFGYVAEQLSARGIVYIHVIEGSTGNRAQSLPFDYLKLRGLFKGTYIANNGYDQAMAETALEADAADLICFGRPFISNPDLVERYRTGAALNPLDQATMYGGGPGGYTDYPALP